MKTSTPRVLHALLLLYVGIAAAYQIVATISRVAEYRQVGSRVIVPFDISYAKPVIASVTPRAAQAGISPGDTVRSINGTSYFGRALWQSTTWAAHPGDSVRVAVTKAGGQLSLVQVPLVGYPYGSPHNNSLRQVTAGRAASLVFIQLVLPGSCLLLGCWVALARPRDPNAWFFLILLTYPSTYTSVGTFEWLPSWLSLRLFWHLTIEIVVPPALLFLGLLFPERGRLDRRLPWLKWLIVAVLAAGLAFELLLEYAAWYRVSLLPIFGGLAVVADPALRWAAVLCSTLYWIALLDKLRTASSPDARRRLQVLLAGSIVGLGSLVIIWGLLPKLGIANPGEIQWLGYLSVVLMLFFPLSLAYVVIVQRAMDVRILLRMGTQYLLARTTLAILRIAGIAGVLWFIALPLIEHHHSPVSTIFWTAVLLALAFLYFKKKSPTDLVGQWIDRKFFREAYDAEIMLASLVTTARTISDPADLIKTVCHQISDVLHVERIAVLLQRDGVFEPAYAIGDPPFAIEFMRSLGNTNSSAPIFNRTTEGHAPDPHKPELLLPLPGRAQLMGAMALSPKQSEAPYTPSDLRLLESVGVQTGMGLELSKTAASLAEAAIERANTTREMEIAREVQERLLPQKLPVIPGLSLAGAYRSVFGIGGDYYDVLQLRDGRLGLAIGDVSGKGISAALLMSSLRACLRTLTLNDSRDITALMRNMNLLVYEASAVNRYATFFLGIYDPATSRLQYVNAGHNPPALIRTSPDGTCQHLRLETGGPVVGLLPDVFYKEDCVVLQPGDVLVTYTDGISEAMTNEEEEWGEEAMILAAELAANETAEEIVKAVFLSADAFTRNAPQHDDMTVFVMKLSSVS